MNRAFWIRAVLSLLIIGGVVLALLGTVDRYGKAHVDAGFKRALITFAVARGLNGVISVAQGTEVAIQPAGVGINFTPGQILDPVNDLIERFSWIMLASTTSLGMQSLIMKIFASPIFSALLGVVAVAALLLLWLRRLEGLPLRRAVLRACILLLIVRFAVPVAAVAAEWVYIAFLEEQYHASTASIEKTRDRIGEINREQEAQIQPEAEGTVVDRAMKWYDSTVASFDFRATIERYRQAAAEVSAELIQLIVIFTFQTIMLPLFFLWLMVRAIRRVTRLDWLMPGAGKAE